MDHSTLAVILCILLFFAGFGIIPATAGISGEVAYSFTGATLNITSPGTEGNTNLSVTPSDGIASAPKEEVSDPVYVPGTVLVIYETDGLDTAGSFDSEAALSANAAIGAMVTKEFTGGVLPGCQVVSLPEGMTVDEAVIYYKGQPGVAYAQPDYIYTIDAVPNDPSYGLQWGLKNTGQVTPQFSSGGTAGADISTEDAWDVTTGSDSVVIAVIDTGVDYLHDDLAANMWDDGAGHFGYDFVNTDNDPMDDNNHGTHCAGIIAAVGNNSVGVSGVCWNAKIMAVKVFDAEGHAVTSCEIAGINWAVSNGANILSCSWGGPTSDAALKTAIENAGILTVCAAGNEGTDNDATSHYPSSYDSPNILSVASTAPDDSISDFSNYGATSVDIGAPGTDIYSTIPREQSMGTTAYSNDMSSLSGWWEYDYTVSGRTAWHLNTTTYTSAPSSAATGAYGNDWDQWLITTGNISLAGMTAPVLRYELSLDTEINYDWIYVGISEDGSNFSFTGLSGTSGGFSTRTYDLTDFSGTDYSGKDIWIAYRLKSDVSTTGGGAWVDDVVIGQLDGPITSEYGYMSGTSMATPMVSGIAGLLLAENSSYTTADLKTAIMESADPIPALTGKCITGARVNASATLGPAPEPEPPIGPPSVTGITPSTGLNTGCTYITALTGMNFTSDMTIQLTHTGETAIPAEFVFAENTTHARCAFNCADALAGDWNVSVTTAGGTDTMTAAFTVTTDSSVASSAQIPVETGWNLISAPRQGPSVDLTNTTPGTLYSYNTEQRMYTSCTAADIIPGNGYWVSATSAANITAIGYACPTYQYGVHAGWNLIGSIQAPVTTGNLSFVPDSLTLSGPVYTYDTGAGQYTETTTLTPGMAYWMAFFADGVMIVG